MLETPDLFNELNNKLNIKDYEKDFIFNGGTANGTVCSLFIGRR